MLLLLLFYPGFSEIKKDIISIIIIVNTMMNNSVSESRHDKWEGCLCRGVNGLVGGWGRMGRVGILSYLIARIGFKQMSSRFLTQKRIVARTLKAFQIRLSMRVF